MMSAAGEAIPLLHVEDDDIAALAVGHLLGREGFAVERAIDGRAAAERIRTAPPPRLVILDLKLPYHDGFELLAMMQAQLAWAQVPVLVLSVRSMEEDIVRAFEGGAGDYVIKPFQPRELLARVRRLLARGTGPLACSLLLAMAAKPAEAATDDMATTMLRLGASTLDSGYDDWTEAALRVEWRRAAVGGAYVELRSLDRYAQHDAELVLGGSRRLGERWDLWGEASFADDPHFVAHHSLALGASRKFGDGWVANGSLRHVAYTDANVVIASGGLERYVGAWRAAWTGFAARRDDHDDTVWSQMLAFDRYHGDEDRVGGFVSWGRQLDSIPGAGVEARSVPAFGLSGRHTFGKGWAFDWMLSWERQGDLYERTGASVGLRRRF
jgi:YaiO family outer membrane protein